MSKHQLNVAIQPELIKVPVDHPVISVVFYTILLHNFQSLQRQSFNVNRKKQNKELEQAGVELCQAQYKIG